MELDDKITKFKRELSAERKKPPVVVEKIVEKVIEKVVEKETTKIVPNTVHEGKDFSYLLDLNLLSEHEFESFMRSLDVIQELEEYSAAEL